MVSCTTAARPFIHLRRGAVCSSSRIIWEGSKSNQVTIHGRLFHVSYNAFQNRQEYPPHTVVPMPALSLTMVTGTIAEWIRKEGDAFVVGDPLCKIETDKATLDLEAQEDGILAKKNFFLVQGENVRDLNYHESSPVTEAGSGSETAKEEISPPTTKRTAASFLPSARHLVESKGVDASGLIGTGKGGRITKGDVLKALGSLPPLLKAEPKSEVVSPSATVVAAAPVMTATSPPPTSFAAAAAAHPVLPSKMYPTII
jgi:pyruvate/2-oxoglutarate dehydrogenase complex dihydrolipoamide acyltransferase (E2) component